MNPFWASLFVVASVLLGTGGCFWLLYHAREVDATVWILEHIVCPVVRILVLLILVSQVYPMIDGTGSSLDFWRALFQQGNFSHLVNLLFLAGLALAFLPFVNHPAIALPVQCLLTVAVVFHWETIDLRGQIDLWPTAGILLKIGGFMLAAFLLTREASLRAGRWIDRHFAVEGSVMLVADSAYLLLQIPVMLIYTGYLSTQLGALSG